MDCNDGNVKGFVGYKYPTTLAYYYKGLRFSDDVLGRLKV